MMDIQLSPNYGLNPSLATCFWCGQAKELVLFGRINPKNKRGRHAEDLEAPEKVFSDYEPCGDCKLKMERGVTIFSASEKPLFKNQPAITVQGGKEAYPTSRYVVMKTEAAKRLFQLDFEDGERIACDNELLDHLLGEEQNQN